MMKSLSIFRLSVLLIFLSVSLNLAADNEGWSSFDHSQSNEHYHSYPISADKPAFMSHPRTSYLRHTAPSLQPVARVRKQKHSEQLFHHHATSPASAYQSTRNNTPYLLTISAPTHTAVHTSSANYQLSNTSYRSSFVRSASNTFANIASTVMSALSPSFHKSSSNSFAAGGQERANSVNRAPSRFKAPPTIGGDVQPNDFDAFMQTASEACLYNIGDVKYYDMNALARLYNEYTQQLLASGNSPKDIPSWDTFISWFNTASSYAAPIGDGVDVVIFLLLLSAGYIAYTRRKKSAI